MSLRKFKIVYHLTGDHVIEQTLREHLRGIDAAVQQKLSQEYLFFIAQAFPRLYPYRVHYVVRYGIEEIDANGITSTVSASTEREGQSLPLLLSPALRRICDCLKRALIRPHRRDEDLWLSVV
jgi:hypothetical protein